METLFNKTSSMRIPKQLNECNKWDETAIALSNWAMRIEKIGGILSAVIAVIGFIFALIAAFAIGDVSNAFSGFVAFVLIVLVWAVLSSIEYFAAIALSLLIGALATITQSSVTSSKVALFMAAQQKSSNTTHIVNEQPTKEQPAEKKKTARTWQCKYCGTINIATDIQCISCDEFRAFSTSATPRADNTWQCESCGTVNKAAHGQCKKCGNYRK